jgi:hypothetical protein
MTDFHRRSLESETQLLREYTAVPIATEHHMTYLLDRALCDFAAQFGPPPLLRRSALVRTKTKYIDAFRSWVELERPVLARIVAHTFPARSLRRRNDEPYLARCLAFHDVRREQQPTELQQQ